MSPAACKILVDEIMPILSATIPRLRLVGSDDHEELQQDAVTSAAQMLDAAERAGKPLLGKSTAYYAIQRTKTGRRSTSGGRTDAMAPSTMLDGLTSVSSLDAPVDTVDGDSDMTLGDMLADHGDDACALAARNIDWSWYMKDLDQRDVDIIRGTAEGTSSKAMAAKLKVTQPRIVQRKRRIGRVLFEKSGGEVMRDAVGKPQWHGNMAALHSRTTRWCDLDNKPVDLAQVIDSVTAA